MVHANNKTGGFKDPAHQSFVYKQYARIKIKER